VHPTGAFNNGLEPAPGPVQGGFAHSFYSRSTLMTVRPSPCQTSLGFIEIDFRREKFEEGTPGTPFSGNGRFAVETRGNEPSLPCGVLLGSALLPAPFMFGSCSLWMFPFAADLIQPTLAGPGGEARFPVPVPSNVTINLFLQPFSFSLTTLFLGEAAEIRVR
jgi:hypothetical protein